MPELVIASTNGQVGIAAATQVLRKGGTAIDAVEAGIRPVEDNPDDRTVSYGGYPTILGEVELDASIMDGQTLKTGAVGAMRGYRYAISVARKVMETLPHVFLVGEGAERFAKESGFEAEGLLTDEIKDIWQRHLKKHMSESQFTNLKNLEKLKDWVALATDPEIARGTVNFIARDKDGNICTGVSTSGWAWSYPGRLGDSPVIGAGNYADNRFGAAACTGMGEMAIRGATAHSVVAALRYGQPLKQAGTTALEDLNHLGGDYISMMHIIAIDAKGNHQGFSTEKGKTYIYQTPGMDSYEELERVHVPVAKRWKSIS